MDEALRSLSGEAPSWPGGRGTRFLGGGEALPEGKAPVALCCLLSRSVGPEEVAGLPFLRIVANVAVGHDNLDVSALRRRGIEVTNTPGVLTRATAELTWALVLAAARRLREGLELALSGEWTGWRPDQLLGGELGGKTLGILGAGRIGVAVARRAPAFGMHVAYWSRSRSPELEEELGASRQGRLEDLLGASDVVSVHLPLAEETRGLLGEPELARMREGSVLVNTARGEIVRTGPLVRALREGPLAAAGLDVYPEEPEIPSALRELPNAFLLPHIGSATRETRRAMWELAAENVRSVLRGEGPITPVSE